MYTSDHITAIIVSLDLHSFAAAVEIERLTSTQKNQMVQSKWLVFNVIIASYCTEYLDISYENINPWTRENTNETEAHKKKNAHTTKERKRQWVHMHYHRACRKKEINLHN